MPMYYAYILQKKDKSFYIGYTDNLERRMKEHSKKNDFQLLYYEAYLEKDMARKRERMLKHYGSAWRALKKRITA